VEDRLSEIVAILPHVNAALNALATVLLITGYVLIKRQNEQAHKWAMLACFGVSVAFLACYVTYHLNIVGGSKRFPSYPPQFIRYSYYGLLLSHILLAASVPFLAVATIWLGLADNRRWHRRLAKWTFPIWLYVSVTGVIVYLLLYQIYPSAG
jgi:putative membrane protein